MSRLRPTVILHDGEQCSFDVTITPSSLLFGEKPLYRFHGDWCLTFPVALFKYRQSTRCHRRVLYNDVNNAITYLFTC